MLIPNKFNGYSRDGIRKYNVDGGIGEAALLGAAMGGGTAAVTGGDPLRGALLGGLTGGVGSGVMGAMGGAAGAAPGALAPVESMGTAAGMGSIPAGVSSAAIPTESALAANAATQSTLAGQNALQSGLDLGGFNPANPATMNAAAVPQATVPSATAQTGNITDWIKANPLKSAGLGITALAALNQRPSVAAPPAYKGPLSRFTYNPDLYRPSTPYAEGGITSLNGDGDMSVGGDPRNNPPPISEDDNSSMGWQSRSYPAQAMAGGGIASLGGYSDGGHMLKGPGDGMSDSIPATIAGHRPARLATDEFVVPADVVSHLGNGSSDAGAKQLYAMMDKVRKARTGSAKQGKQINPGTYMPA